MLQRRFQFRLLTVLMLMALIAVSLEWYLRAARLHAAEQATLLKLDGQLRRQAPMGTSFFDIDHFEGTYVGSYSLYESHAPNMFQPVLNYFEVASFNRTVELVLLDVHLDEKCVPDVMQLRSLQRLILVGGSITDKALIRLRASQPELNVLVYSAQEWYIRP